MFKIRPTQELNLKICFNILKKHDETESLWIKIKKNEIWTRKDSFLGVFAT